MIELFANNAQSTLAGSITNSATTVNLQSGGGAQFPNPTVGAEYFRGTFTDAATGLETEIVLVTHRVGDTLTITRGQEGTTPRAWAANDLFDNMMTAGTAGSFLQEGEGQAQSGNWANDTGSANAYSCTLSPALTVHTKGMPIRLFVANTNTGASTFNPGPGAKNIRRRDGSALIGLEMLAGAVPTLIYDGTNYIIQQPAPATPAAISTGTDTQSFTTPKQLADATIPVSNQTVQVFTTPGAFTYTPTSADVKSCWVRYGGGGGGGGATGGTTGPNGSAGTDSIFNGVHAKGGSGGGGNATASGLGPSAGGAGGTGGTGTAQLRIPGQKGGVQALSSGNGGGAGGSAPFFGGGAMALTQDVPSDGLPGEPNTGGGGGGSFSPGATQGAAGGGSGEYVELWLNAPVTTYAGSVGAGGAGGVGTGSLAQNGGAGAAGKVIVVENY